MNHDDVVTLLQTVQAYDNRNLDRITIMAWSEAAARAGWTIADASEAVHEHFKASTVWMMPGHVTEAIRRPKRQPANARDILAIDGPPPASAETRRAAVEAFRQAIEERKAAKADEAGDAGGSASASA